MANDWLLLRHDCLSRLEAVVTLSGFKKRLCINRCSWVSMFTLIAQALRGKTLRLMHRRVTDYSAVVRGQDAFESRP